MRFAIIGSILLLAACAVDDAHTDDHDHDCEIGEHQCDGDVLEICDEAEGWVTEEDCAASEMMCHADMGHCM